MILRLKIACYKPHNISQAFIASYKQGIYGSWVELDTHADTIVAGRKCLLMHYTKRVCDVLPYSDEYEAKKSVPIVQIATGYTAANGQRTILIVNKALWIPELEHSLMNPNQLRHFSVTVQDNPYSNSPMVIQKNNND